MISNSMVILTEYICFVTNSDEIEVSPGRIAEEGIVDPRHVGGSDGRSYTYN